ncbi:MAG: MerC domain-containing protein [Muribaculaceae bacterium]|nr:MerC domain-containing protein [Muribaculaceae bacterium]
MKKTILSLAMMLMMTLGAAAAPVIQANADSKEQVEFKGDTMVVSDGDNQVTVTGLPGLQKVRDKINKTLDDTLTASNGESVDLGFGESDLTAEDMKYMSDHWGEVLKQISYASIAGVLGLVFLVLLFRFLNRRNKYRVIERAIENNYPLNELSLNDAKRSAIYVQQPVVTSTPQQPGEVTVGTPLPGATPSNPVVMTDMVNWRALMPAVKWLGIGLVLFLFGIMVAGGEDPFTPVGVALIVVGLCKGFILYKEQKALQEASRRAQQMQPREPMRQGSAVPPAFDQDYKEDDSTPYQPY